MPISYRFYDALRGIGELSKIAQSRLPPDAAPILCEA
jgi:hypothetical protein